MGKKIGLPAGIPIAIGEMDVHYGAFGSGVPEGALVKVIGTSPCDCGVVSADKTEADISGIRGIVKGGSSQDCAIDYAVSAAVLADAHPYLAAAQKKIPRLTPGVAYKPNAANQKIYNRLYAL